MIYWNEKYGCSVFSGLIDNSLHATKLVRVVDDFQDVKKCICKDTPILFLPCGHRLYNLGYSDSSKCMACDVENFIDKCL
jgi:hypothetical protein